MPPAPVHSRARIWIIGASAGIGAALARAYAAEGAALILSSRCEAALKELAEDMLDTKILPLDLAQRGDLQRVVDMIEPGSLDAIICTAALYDPGRVQDIDDEALEDLINVNLVSQFHLAKHARSLLRPGGQFVMFGSVAGYLGLPKGQPYSATKAAIINLAETLRIELAPSVDVRLVCPGFVETRLTEKNTFTMPALISADEAARQVIRGMRGKRFEIHFPRRFTLLLKLLRALPYGLSLRLTKRLG